MMAGDNRPASPRGAIATLLIGEKYVQMWRRHCEPNWRIYAEQHGFDLLVHESVIDTSQSSPSRSLAWQKLLIGTLEQSRKYPYLIWLDADIVINVAEGLRAPDILNGVEEGRIGAVRYHALLRQPLFETAHRQICGGMSACDYNTALFRSYGLEADPLFLLNTGVLVVPRSRYSFLAEVYDKYRLLPVNPQQQEQVVLSYEMYANGVTHFIDEKFNAVWYEYKYSVYFGDGPKEFNKAAIKRILSQVYFLHFAGNQNDMLLL
jgi:hypothetical protein